MRKYMINTSYCTHTCMHTLTHTHIIYTDCFNSFQILPEYISQGIPYDYASIMHYTASEFSKNGQFTIVPINNSVSPDILNSAITPTPYDYLHVNLLYCGGKRAIHKHKYVAICKSAHFHTRLYTWYVHKQITVNIVSL